MVSCSTGWQAGAGPFFFPCTDTVTYVIMEWCRQGREKLVNAGAPEEVTACFRGTGAGGHEYDTDALLALVQQMRLGQAADLYGNTSTTTAVQPAAGTDLGDGDGDEAIESNDSEEEGPSSTLARDPGYDA